MWKCEITKTFDNPEDKNIITYFNSGDTLKILNDGTLARGRKEQALINKILMDLNFTEDEKQKGLAVIPFSVDGHSTTLMIKLKPETARKMYIEDFSTYHLQDNQVRPNLLGKASEYCEVLNISPIQLNGTCNFWMLAFCQVAKEYAISDSLINDCKNGVIDIKVANKMCEFFGVDRVDKLFSNVQNNTKRNKITIIRSNTVYYFSSEQIKNNLFLDLSGLINDTNRFNFSDKDITSREELKKIIEKQEERSEITYELGVIQENIEKYTRKLIRNNPLVLDLKKKLVELNNKLASTNNNDYESVNELYVEIIGLENKMSNFPKKKKELYERYKTFLEETKIEEDFDIKKLITLVDNNSIKSDDQKIKNLKVAIETSFKNNLTELEKTKSKDSVDNYRIKKIYSKRAENLAILREKEPLTEIEQVQRESLQEQLKPKNERDDLNIKKLYKMLEINCINLNKGQLDNNELGILKEYFSLEKDILEKEIEIRNKKIDLAKDPNNSDIISNINSLQGENINNRRLIKEDRFSDVQKITKKAVDKIQEFSLIKNQQELWNLENKFDEERFVDNRREHEKSETITQPKENFKKPSSQSPPSKHLSFTQKENFRRQQRQRPRSTPAELGH